MRVNSLEKQEDILGHKKNYSGMDDSKRGRCKIKSAITTEIIPGLTPWITSLLNQFRLLLSSIVHVPLETIRRVSTF